MWYGRAPDLRVAFIATSDGPNVVTSPDDPDSLATPGSLKICGPSGDDGLRAGVIGLELPLSVTVIISNDGIHTS